jgi:hypothetical protein
MTAMRRSICLLGCAALAGAGAPAHAAPGDAPRAAARAPAGKPPSPPSIAPGTRTFVAFAGRPAQVRLTWPAMPGVARYRARWTQSGALIDIELAGTATAFEREVSSAGHHQLTVVAIDAAGRESPPVEVGVDIVAVAAIAPGFDEPLAGNVPAFALGARFRSAGLTCTLGDAPAGPEAVAQKPGAATLRCSVQGGPRIELPVVIAPVIVEGPKRPLVRGVATKVHLTVASVARIGEHLDVEAADADLGPVRRTEHGLEVAVTPRDGAVASSLVVRARRAAGEPGGPGPVVGRVELVVADPPPPPPPPPERTAWFALDLGYHVGVIAPTGDRPAIGDSAREIIHRPLGGVRVGLFPTRRVGLETELALAAPDYRPAQKTWVVAARAQVAARVLDGAVGLTLVGGAGVLSTSGAVHYGGAFTFETRRNLWLRLEVLHVMTVARDAGYAHCLEVQLGLVTRLGRRDRG